MTDKKPIQKVKFNGNPNQIFHIGQRSFPSGVWIAVNDKLLETIIKVGASVFDFNPPIEKKVKEKVEKKPKKKSKKKKQKGGK